LINKADYIPILIAYIKIRNIAACHAGLKGLKKANYIKNIKKIRVILI
tara:strand:+ start:412 stop:555 length:144 start_codon:yes stop_codon:yes gene_type:complete